jgi:uncharacterized membrane protein
LSGAGLALSLSVTFTAQFSGQKNIYMFGTNGTTNSGWQTMGTWTVQTPAGPVVSVVSVTPSSGSGAQQTFTSQYSDSTGATDLTQAWLWFNTGLTLSQEGNSCLVYLDRAANQLFLYNDAGSGWLPPVAVGASSTLGNSQCSIAMGSGAVTVSGTNLALSLTITFSQGFAGAKNIYAYGLGTSVNSGWRTMGTWTVPGAAPPGVSAVSVTPSSGSGSQQTFTFRYSDSNGATDLTQVWLWFNTGLTFSHGADSCLLYLARPSNTLYLYSDVSESWLSPATLGTSATLGHSLCSINVASSSVTLSGAGLALSLSVTFTAQFSGQKNIYMFGTNGTVNSGWQTMGTWTVQAGASSMVSAVSATPSSGSGSQQTFTLQYFSTGATDLTQVWLWFNAGLTLSQEGNSCLVYLDRAANQLFLYNDAGSGWLPSAAVGASSTLGNSQCSIAMGSAAVTVSGTNLTLSLPITFSAGFAGTKSIYAYALGASVNSGWQTMGTWTVPGAAPPGVSAVSVTPSSGSGLQQTFTFQYSDSNGATDLTQVWLWFNTGLTFSHGADSCLLYLARPSNTLHLYSDVSESWLAPATLGTSATLGHSLCSINVASSSVTLSGAGLALTLPVTFTSQFSGQKNIYMFGTNGTTNSGWQTMGTWTVP